VDSGQVAFGNHTWSHPDLTTLGDREVAEEITRNQDFLRATFGIRDTPFLRPPFGARDERIDPSPRTSAIPRSPCGTAPWRTSVC
jgi:peptidoglycan/xylan/chitin deacetylase (PgdA/CDA1 family)